MTGIRMVDVPGYSNGWIAVRSGQYVRIVDVEGCQVGDLFAVSQADHDEFMSPSVTRLHNGNLFPETGQRFFTNRDRPVFTFVADRSPGCHDMLYASCNRDWYAGRGLMDHPNCRDNYFEAVREAGIGHVLQPDPVNLFQNTPPRCGRTVRDRRHPERGRRQRHARSRNRLHRHPHGLFVGTHCRRALHAASRRGP